LAGVVWCRRQVEAKISGAWTLSEEAVSFPLATWVQALSVGGTCAKARETEDAICLRDSWARCIMVPARETRRHRRVRAIMEDMIAILTVSVMDMESGGGWNGCFTVLPSSEIAGAWGTLR